MPQGPARGQGRCNNLKLISGIETSAPASWQRPKPQSKRICENPHQLAFLPLTLLASLSTLRPSMTEKPEAYVKCLNCGKIILKSHTLDKGFCSKECAVHYLKCPNCGGFFSSKDIDNMPYCSKECAQEFKLELIEEDIEKYKELL